MNANEQLNDTQAIESVLAGDSGSFEILVCRYQNRLFNALSHLLSDRHEAEEVVQDAMLQAYAKLSTFRGGSTFYTWLYRIAFNLAMSRQRKKRPKVSLNEMQEKQGLDPIGDGATPDANLHQCERATRVHRALGKLSEEYRAVLVLREMEDCDYDTISQVLDIPVGTVRSRLSRARTTMRDLLRESIEELDTP